ncbi:hypothetical protein K438DRAFT_1778554 [Mycena galopus ATCC 62051]|nr:hypothetical protein K438DRAFT_1778554 [Mycena galopus ATCC 62051]
MEERGARAPQASSNGHLASAASATESSLRRGEGSVWQHFAYPMGSNGERARPRLGGRRTMRTPQTKQTRSSGVAWLSETFSDSPPPQRLATPTPHRLPHSVYEEEALSRLDWTREMKIGRTGPQRGNAKKLDHPCPRQGFEIRIWAAMGGLPRVHTVKESQSATIEKQDAEGRRKWDGKDWEAYTRLPSTS